MAREQQKAKDSAMAARLAVDRHHGPEGQRRHKRNRFQALMAQLAPSRTGSTKQQRRQGLY